MRSPGTIGGNTLTGAVPSDLRSVHPNSAPVHTDFAPVSLMTLSGKAVRQLEVTLELRVLGPDDVAHMESMLSLFGRAFGDPDSYDKARPGSAYLAGLLG